MARRLAPELACALLAAVVYAGTLSFGFLSYDDPIFILQPAVRPRRTSRDLAIAFGLYACALATKSTAIFFGPFLVVEAALRRRLDRRELLRLAPFVALSLASGIVVVVCNRSIGNVTPLRGD